MINARLISFPYVYYSFRRCWRNRQRIIKIGLLASRLPTVITPVCTFRDVFLENDAVHNKTRIVILPVESIFFPRNIEWGPDGKYPDKTAKQVDQ